MVPLDERSDVPSVQEEKGSRVELRVTEHVAKRARPAGLDWLPAPVVDEVNPVPCQDPLRPQVGRYRSFKRLGDIR